MESRCVLFRSPDTALVGDLARRVHREGHDVRYHIDAEPGRKIGDGSVPKTDDWRAELDRADVVVFDDIWIGSDVNTGELARELRKDGHAVVVGTLNTDRPEDDRGYATDVREAHGGDTLDHCEFTFEHRVQDLSCNRSAHTDMQTSTVVA